MCHWKNNLVLELRDPSKWLLSTEEIVVVKDRYPKAKHHFLVMPRAAIQSIFHLTCRDVGLLDQMFTMALRIILKNSLLPKSFQIGYHARPSLNQLHLHVISNDFNSPTMRTKKHWNSFTTDLFIPHYKLVAQLNRYGHIQRLNDDDYYALSNGTPLKCNICRIEQITMDDLKTHIRTHLA